ncbi:MAG: AI-2E family transporter, partial [Microbacteriaceae bacterium]|nr:AI-2E family transporter [Microbacteriaceae bacterium]
MSETEKNTTPAAATPDETQAADVTCELSTPAAAAANGQSATAPAEAKQANTALAEAVPAAAAVPAKTAQNASSSAAADSRNAAYEVPLGFRVTAAWSWRFIIIGLAIAGVAWLLSQVTLLLVPFFIAVLLTALLQPVMRFAERMKLPRGIGVLISLAVLFSVVSLLLWIIITQFRSGFADLYEKAKHSWDQLAQWLIESPLHIDLLHIEFDPEAFMATLHDNQDKIVSGAVGVASGAANMLAGAILVLFCLIFLLLDGRQIWFWVLGFMPSRAHAAVHQAATAGWRSVVQYVRVQIFVAFVDAVGIALGALVLGLPMVLPIGVMVFLGSFIPFLGAIITGLIASLIAFIYSGPTAALVMLIIVLLVQQIEGNILQPLVMGTAVQVHPLGVVFAVSLGALIAGVP